MSDDISPHPEDYEMLSGFKSAWYAEHEVGSWLDDIKLAFLYYEKRDEPLPDELEEIADTLQDS